MATAAGRSGCLDGDHADRLPGHGTGRLAPQTRRPGRRRRLRADLQPKLDGDDDADHLPSHVRAHDAGRLG